MKKFKKWLKQFQKENDRSPTIEEVYDEATKTVAVERFEAYGQCRDSRRIADLENKLANVSYQLEGREVELKELQEELSACKFAMAMSEKVEKQLREQIEKMKQVLELAYKSLCRYETNINGISVTITAESEKVSFYNWLKDVERLIGKE